MESYIIGNSCSENAMNFGAAHYTLQGNIPGVRGAFPLEALYMSKCWSSPAKKLKEIVRGIAGNINQLINIKIK